MISTSMLNLHKMFNSANRIIRKNIRLSNLLTERFSHISRNSNRVKVHIIPALQDNYMYVMIDSETMTAAAVDPVEPEKVINVAEKEGVKLTTVLTTHHHYDHAGGNKTICEMVKNLIIYGGDDRIDCVTHKVSDGVKLQFGSLEVNCLLTPCHTNGHICYFIPIEKEQPICFTGDTLFVAGCGRFFEGTAQHMFEALNKLSSLPHNTEIYCGHEYTVNNLKFAVHVEPNNMAAKKKLQWSINTRNTNQPTIPSTLQDEITYNPFMRTKEKDVQFYTKKTNPVEVMAVLRKAKDNFKT